MDVGTKKSQPRFELIWKNTAQSSGTLPSLADTNSALESHNVEAEKMKHPIAIFMNSFGSEERPACQRQNMSSSGMDTTGAKPSRDCNQGTGIVQAPTRRS